MMVKLLSDMFCFRMVVCTTDSTCVFMILWLIWSDLPMGTVYPSKTSVQDFSSCWMANFSIIISNKVYKCDLDSFINLFCRYQATRKRLDSRFVL